MKKRQAFEKRIVKGNTTFHFIFTGTEKTENIDYEKIYGLIDNCFDKFQTYDDMVINVAWIRTILKDFDETYLSVNTTNSMEDYQWIKYINKEKFEYTIEKKFGDKKFKMKHDFDEEYKISFSGTTKELDNDYNKNIEIIKENIEVLTRLKKITPIELDEESKIICEIYKLFYNEYPDFSSKDISIKVQAMMSILTEFGICINDNISFMMNYKNIPISLYLQQKIENYAPLGKIETMDNSIKLSEYATNIIKIVSEVIRGSIPKDYDEIEVLPRISSIIYTKVHKISSKAKINEIAEITHSAEEEVKSTLKLVKSIKNKLRGK